MLIFVCLRCEGVFLVNFNKFFQDIPEKESGPGLPGPDIYRLNSVLAVACRIMSCVVNACCISLARAAMSFCPS